MMARTAAPAPVQVSPTTVTVVYGRVVAGDVNGISTVDGITLKLSKFVVPVVPVDPVTFRVESNLPAVPTSLAFHLIGRAVHFGTYTQSLNLYDWNRNLFDPLTNVTSPLLPTDGEMVCQHIGDVSKFYRVSDLRVWALVRVRAIGFTPVNNWQVEYDRAWFEMDTGL